MVFFKQVTNWTFLLYSSLYNIHGVGPGRPLWPQGSALFMNHAAIGDVNLWNSHHNSHSVVAPRLLEIVNYLLFVCTRVGFKDPDAANLYIRGAGTKITYAFCIYCPRRPNSTRRKALHFYKPDTRTIKRNTIRS